MNRILYYCKDEPPPFDGANSESVSRWISYLNDRVYFEFLGIQEGSWDA